MYWLNISIDSDETPMCSVYLFQNTQQESHALYESQAATKEGSFSSQTPFINWSISGMICLHFYSVTVQESLTFKF